VVEGLIGSDFADTLIGDSAGNVLQGLDGNDRLEGQGGNDFLLGGGGDDILIGGPGADNLNGGDRSPFDGFDYASYETATAGVTASIDDPTVNTGDAAGDRYFVEGLIGSNFDDTLIGASKLTIESADGNVLQGLDGDDRLDGQGGNDLLIGGNGADRFVFRSGYGSDRIADFAPGSDTIEVQNALASTFAEIQSYESQVGADVVITFTSGDILTLSNTLVANLHENDFLFAA
jgi:serralysin